VINVSSADIKDNSANSTMNDKDSPKNKEASYNPSNNQTNEEITKRIQKGMEIMADSSNNETDMQAIETMKKTGNWGYIEKYIPQMTNDGIEKIVEIYNSKKTDTSQHKKAADYIKG
jgi:hypothetical protein